MLIRLRFNGSTRFTAREYIPGLDNIQTILSEACRCVKPICEFSVSGFGQDRWPVDVDTDLPVFLEQLPSLIGLVRQKKPAELDFYEQGIERYISLEPVSGNYKATCRSLSCWQPNPESAEISASMFLSMLTSANDAFMGALAGMAPELVGHRWVREWQSAMNE